MKLNRRTALYILLGTFLFCAATLVDGLVYLSSEAGSQRLIAWMREALQRDFDTRLEYAEGRVDIFSGLHFKNLKINHASEGQQIDIFIESLDANYEISLLKRSIGVSSLRIVHPQIKFVSRSSEIKEEAESETESEPGAFEKLILDPVATVVVREFVLEGLNLDLEQVSPGTKMKTKLKGFSLALDLEMKKERLRSQGRFNTSEPVELSLESSKPIQEVRAEGIAKTLVNALASGQWDFSVYRDINGEWVHELKSAELQALLSDLSSRRSAPAAHSDLVLSRLNVSSKQKFLAKTKRLFALDPNSIETLDFGTDVEIGPFSLTQSNGGKTTKIEITSQKAKLRSQLRQEINFDLSYEASQVRAPEFMLKPSDGRLTATGQVTRDLQNIKLASRLSLAGTDLVTLEGAAESGPSLWEEAKFSGKIQLGLEARLSGVLKSLAALKDTGTIQAALDIDGQLNQGGSLSANLQLSAGVSEFGNWLLKTELKAKVPASEREGFKSDGKTVLVSTSPVRKGQLPVSLAAPLTLSHSVDMTPGRQTIVFNIDSPDIMINDVGRAQGMKISAKANSPDFTAAKELAFNLDLTQAAMELKRPLGGGLSRLSSLQLSAVGGLSGGREFALTDLKVSVAKPSMNLSAHANGDLMAKNVLAQIEAGIALSERDSALQGQKLSGRIKIPATLTVSRGEEINLSGGIDISGLAWSKGPIAVSGVSGRLPFSESLKWNGEELRFARLITQNPFERVDFERVRPLLQGAERLTIEKIRWEDKSYGPMIGFFSLRQNMISVHQFDLDLSSGRSYGQMYFDAYPSNLQFGILARLTGVDLGDVLPSKFLARAPQGEKKLSGRMGLVLDLRRSSVDGRMDITEIGGSQLTALLGVFDPTYEDEKLNKVRGLLQVGYPTEVALGFNDGYLDLEVALQVLGLANRQRLTSIPVSGLLSKATADFIKTTEKGPLK